MVYEGTRSIKFPPFVPERNLTVISGLNGFGKTSLLRAMQFVFHGIENNEAALDCWNEKASAAGSGRLEVVIEFLHSSQPCKIARFVDFTPTKLGQMKISHGVKFFRGGKQIEHLIEDQIALIIPKDCSQFVFFDGAEIMRYAAMQQAQGVKESIEQVLGLPAVRNLRSDLGKVVEELDKTRRALMKDCQDADDAAEELAVAVADQQLTETQNQKNQSLRNTLEKKVAELEKESIHLSAIRDERALLEKKKEQKTELSQQLKAVETKQLTEVQSAGFRLLGGRVGAILADCSQTSANVPSTKGSPAVFGWLDALIQSNSCCCGRPMDGQAKDNISKAAQSLRETAAPYRTNNRYGLTKEDIASLDHFFQKYQAAAPVGGLTAERAKLSVALEEVQQDIEDINLRLVDHRDIDVKKIFQHIDQTREQIRILDRELGQGEDQLKRTEARVASLRRRIDSLSQASPRAKQQTKQIQEVEHLQKCIDKLLTKLVSEKRSEIEAKASENLVRVTNKSEEYRCVRVNEEYALEVVRHDGSFILNKKLSPGEKEVLAYSFITALNLAASSPAPFVMDTPFGHLDSQHRDQLVRSLSHLPVQVVLLATDRDLPNSERAKLSGNIAREYEIVRNQREARSDFKEVND